MSVATISLLLLLASTANAKAATPPKAADANATTPPKTAAANAATRVFDLKSYGAKANNDITQVHAQCHFLLMIM